MSVQVINGRKYDTATATEVGSYDAGLGAGDFRDYRESLYLTKRGQFFLEGSGGPMTRWARQVGNMKAGGRGIQLLDRDEALMWCEQHDIDVDVLEKYFDIEDG